MRFGLNFSQVPTKALRQLESLRSLSLRSNKIESLKELTFRNWRSGASLHRLDLSWNRISDDTFDNSALHSLHSLNELSLEGNNVNDLLSLFKYKLKMQEESMSNLNLAFNNIEGTISLELPLKKLFTISLENNRISRIAPRFFAYAKQVRFAYLSNNKLAQFPSETFWSTRSLQVHIIEMIEHAKPTGTRP